MNTAGQRKLNTENLPGKLHRQPIEQLRVRWRFPLDAEVFDCRDDAATEEFSPPAIDGDSANKRVIRRDDPTREVEPVG